MSPQRKTHRCRIGFLTVTEAPESGSVGGLLITNQLGRPLEFQCTSPVRPNRTQQILYGPTLAAFVQVELIGQTLLERAEVVPELLLVRSPLLLELSESSDIPVAALLPTDHPPGPLWDQHARSLGGNQIAVPGDHRALNPLLDRIHEALPESVDLNEPFERIHEALDEALRAAA